MKQKRKELPYPKELPLLEEVRRERIRFDFQKKIKRRIWARLYMGTVATVVAVLLVALGVMGVFDLFHADPIGVILPLIEGILLPEQSCIARPQQPPTSPTPSKPVVLTPEQLYQWSEEGIPTGQLPIIPMDLSLTQYGDTYLHNQTGLEPDAEALLTGTWQGSGGPMLLSFATGPQVLILHTHGTESYSPDGAVSYKEENASLHSEDPEESVVAVGRVLADELNRRGIAAVHCTIMHDQTQYKDSYARAEATIREYLERYPTIRLVIDVHRDSILKSTGEMIRPVTVVDGEAAAQVMCVVGSNWGGDENPNWEGNLALALQLRKQLNDTYGNLCRPPYLKSSTYNQELAPYSLLLEIGATGNSIPEAERSAAAVAEILAEMIPDL